MFYLEINFESHILVRPYLNNFLKYLSRYYEIVIFTAGIEDYAHAVLDVIDPYRKYIKYILDRRHTKKINGYYIKDISNVGRDIQKVIIIDDIPQSFCMQY